MKLKQIIFSLYKLISKLGIHVLPVHYYSPVPDINELKKTKNIWAKKSDLPGINIDLNKQVRTLKKICLPYQVEYENNVEYIYAVTNGFGPGFDFIEAQTLHAVIRYFKPKNIIEVGSGVSTWCSLKAGEMNEKETGEKLTITCIEPFPSKKLLELDSVNLIKSKVQTIPFHQIANKLGEDDLLFIDSTHAVKPGSDVNYLILEILPRLNSGVIVHFHDIYLPYDYKRSVLQTMYQWSETSLLHAYLINNNKAKIMFCESHLHYERKKELKEIFPEYIPQKDAYGIQDAKYKPFENIKEHFPSSTYIRIK
tara:strand:- start:251 stop:1180 length:930 start_codon:yes stop_codon:yes gene_type:complete